MIANQEVEFKENSSVTLKITVGKDAVKQEYDELVRKYSQSVQIRGFRRGKVPADVLIRKFGDALQAETTEQVIQKSLDEALPKLERQPLPYAAPRVDTADPAALDSDYTFEVSFDVFPDVKLGETHGLQYEELQVPVTEEDIERELKGLQEQNSYFVDKPDGKVEPGTIVNIDYVELDDKEKERAATRRESFVFEVGTGYNPYKIDDELAGLTAGEERIVHKSYPADFELKELAGRDLTLKVKVNSVKEKKLPELNDELAQDISDKYKTLQALTDDIRNRLNETARARVRENSISQLLDKIVDSSIIPLPESMVEVELEGQWRNFLAQYRMEEEQFLKVLKGQEDKSKEGILAEWRPAAERRLKLLLAVETLTRQENVEVSDEEIEAEIKRHAEARQTGVEETREALEKAGQLDQLRDHLKTEKAYDKLLEASRSVPGKEAKLLDLLQGNY